MSLKWIKSYLPRGLYGRAALILVLPIILLQLLVSIVFIQRHFDGVTELMTNAVNIELRFLIRTVDEAPDLATARANLAAIAEPLRIVTQLPANAEPNDTKPWVDLTGQIVIDTIRARIPATETISLEDRRRVLMWANTAHGTLEMSFARRRVSASNPHQLIVIMVVMGGLMTAIAYLFLRNQLRPIKRMASAATAYGKGRLVHFNPTGAVEVRAAGMAFLDMRNRLERQTQSRTLMLSGVSHDLRTPLTRLRLGLSMLENADVEPLLRDLGDMEQLVDSFLDFVRSDAEDVLETVIPQQIVEDILEAAARMGQSADIGELSGPRVEVNLRPLAIRRALENLLNNALRYGERATVGVVVSDRAVRFVVEDDGPGIPPDKRDDAINPFVRLDPARNQDRGSGVGLGLSIVADIARSHGGVLRLGESHQLGGLKAELVLAR